MQLLEMNQAGSDLKVDDDDEVQKGYDSDDWLTLPNKDVFIKYYQQLRESDGKERKVTELVKINAGGGRDFTYYITFNIDNEGNEETFQAKVEITIQNTIKIPIWRRKRSKLLLKYLRLLPLLREKLCFLLL
ncbi:hypothetical protein RND71_022772 [Anisodus tanguticus]|uniref:Uncharacterized protein n=1 Tax=Anisodus tanguticus TaxID=243964 RepID=A0AAE1RTK6_9SOLA|nr:hypothetical protein RND71_022772 [Anisodus tanguticus]